MTPNIVLVYRKRTLRQLHQGLTSYTQVMSNKHLSTTPHYNVSRAMHAYLQELCPCRVAVDNDDSEEHDAADEDWHNTINAIRSFSARLSSERVSGICCTCPWSLLSVGGPRLSSHGPSSLNP
eukprot:44794-Eustigmatos_ZCMA.PRE.1